MDDNIQSVLKSMKIQSLRAADRKVVERGK